MGYTYTDRRWWCPNCGRINSADAHSQCQHCDAPRTFEMTYAQAVAVARELNRLERECEEAESWACVFNGESKDLAKKLADKQKECAGLSAMLAVSTLSVARPHQKQPCGHERRFVMAGDDKDIDPHGKSDRGKTGWCALCGLEGLRAELREHHAAERWAEEATDESN